MPSAGGCSRRVTSKSRGRRWSASKTHVSVRINNAQFFWIHRQSRAALVPKSFAIRWRSGGVIELLISNRSIPVLEYRFAQRTQLVFSKVPLRPRGWTHSTKVGREYWQDEKVSLHLETSRWPWPFPPIMKWREGVSYFSPSCLSSMGWCEINLAPFSWVRLRQIEFKPKFKYYLKFRLSLTSRSSMNCSWCDKTAIASFVVIVAFVPL